MSNLINKKEIEKDIKKYVFSNKNNNFNHIIENDSRFEIFYHFSEMRRSLFNWYSFKKGSTLLELGGEYGALTGIFCEKCRSVTTMVNDEEEASIISSRYRRISNLKIKIGKIDKLVIQEKFDYIVLVGEVNVRQYVNFLDQITCYLKKDGTILMAMNNKYGIRYFCGERDPVTNKPFGVLNQSRENSLKIMFSRQEMIHAIEKIPGIQYKFYYPLPDYCFTQLIFTDIILPSSNIKERLLSYTKDSSTLVMNENILYDDIIDNKVFPFFANSFLIECSLSNHFDSTIYGTLSTDRGKNHGFATLIYQDGTARKIALYREGNTYLDNLMQNIHDISIAGVNVVPHRRKENMIIMPVFSLPTLSMELESLLKNNNLNRFLELFDILYQEILKSSEQIGIEESECYKINNKIEFWGPILKKAYIDMIPINCFVEKDKLYFFDQEFIRNNFPAGYVMFRAIKYTYQFMSIAEKKIPINRLKEKYGLKEAWSYYLEFERQFVAENRDYKTYSSFTSWCRRDEKEIQKNILRLSGDRN